MSGMVERVARAIEPHAWGRAGKWNDTRSAKSRRTVSMFQARAAIEAMREPTEAMRVRMAETADCRPTAVLVSELTCAEMWRQAIDFALESE